MIDEVNDALSLSNKEEISEQMISLLPNAENVFNAQTALTTLKEMMICLEKPQVYYLNDYHYLMLYDTLSNLCDLHNAAVEDCKTEEDRKQISQIGDYYIDLFDPEDMFQLGLEGRKEKAINEETFAVIQGLIPHPEELALKEYDGDIPIATDSSPYFGSKSKVYPDFDYKKDE
jgi:hypothetical protein